MSAQLKAVNVLKLAAAATITENTNGSAVDLRPYDGDVKLVLNASATGGADETLDVKIQHSSDNSSWSDAGVAFAQVTNAAASFQVLNVTAEQFKRYIRAVDTVAGTTPTVTRSVELVGRLR